MADLIRTSVAGQQMATNASLSGSNLFQSADDTFANVMGAPGPERYQWLGWYPQELQDAHYRACGAVVDEDYGSDRSFFVAAGGFDSHDNQEIDQPVLLGDVSDSLAAFNAALPELEMDDSVTTFTQSDFGRTLTSNGDGTDHVRRPVCGNAGQLVGHPRR
jgi:uncharacterized protein (DUF1501 family)